MVLVLSLTGWSAAAGELPKTVRIAAVAYFDTDKPAFTGAPSIIQQQGWLAAELQKRGVALEWVPATHSSVATVINEAFANRSIDFADYGDLPSIIVNAGGVETRVLVPSGVGLDTYLVVPANSTAKTIADLKGKRVAIHRGRPWELPFMRLLETNGLKYSDFKLINMNPVAANAALAAGNIDAVYTLSDAFILEDKKVGKIIWSTKTAPVDWKMRAELWGAKEFIDKYPELTQLVATAHVKAAYWSAQEQNHNELIRLYTRPGTPESVTRREYDDSGWSWQQRWSPLFDTYVLDHYRHAVTYAFEKKLIRKPVPAETLLDQRFLAAALKELGLTQYWQPRAPNVAAQ
jgi:sulfonate transport system substrate-binding protein